MVSFNLNEVGPAARVQAFRVKALLRVRFKATGRQLELERRDQTAVNRNTRNLKVAERKSLRTAAEPLRSVHVIMPCSGSSGCQD
jgi:hypothetical protein